QVDHAVLAINTDDLGFNFFAFLQNVTRVFNAVTADFGGLQYCFNFFVQGNGGAFGVNRRHGTLNDGALVVQLNELGKRIAFQLLDAQGDALTLWINRQDNGFNFVALLVFTNSFFASLVPADVRQVNQTIDATVQADEDTEVCDGLDLAGDTVALVEVAGEIFPRVGNALLDTQGDTTTLFVDIQNHHFNFVAYLNNLGRMDVLVGPIHFGYVNQTFNTLFQLGKAAVVGQVGNASSNLGTFRVTTFDVDPGIFAQLLQTQRHTVALTVELQDLNVDFVAHIHDFARMLDTLPGHIRDVQQAVNTAQIYERTVVGQVLDDTLDFQTLGQGFQQSFTLLAVFSFQNGAAGNNHVVTLLVQLDNLEFELFVLQVRGVANRTNVYQGTRQEGTDASQINSETTFDLAIDNTLDHFFSFEGLLENLPRFSALGLFTGQTGFTETVFNCIESHIDNIADSYFQLAFFVQELGGGDNAFGLQSVVNGDPVVVDVNYGSLDDGTRLHVYIF